MFPNILFFPTDEAEETLKIDRCHRLEIVSQESSEPLLKEVLIEVGCCSKYEVNKHFCWRAIARQQTILYNSEIWPKFVRCKIGDMCSRLLFLYLGIQRCLLMQVEISIDGRDKRGEI